MSFAKCGKLVPQSGGYLMIQARDPGVAGSRRGMHPERCQAQAALHRARCDVDELHASVGNHRLTANEHAAPDHEVVLALGVLPGRHPAGQEAFGQQSRDDDGSADGSAKHRGSDQAGQRADDRQRHSDQGELDAAGPQQTRRRTQPRQGHVGGGLRRPMPIIGLCVIEGVHDAACIIRWQSAVAPGTSAAGPRRGRHECDHCRMPLFAFEGHAPTVSTTAWIAPTATLVGDVRVEDEASIWYGAVLRADFGPIIIRRGANIQDGSVLHGGHDPVTEVGEGATVGHLCVVHSAVIGTEALIGNGAIVLDGAIIGIRALVAAGCTVPPGMVIPDGMLAVGTPAKVAREVSGTAKEWVDTNPEVYRELARRHATGITPVPPSRPPG